MISSLLRLTATAWAGSVPGPGAAAGDALRGNTDRQHCRSQSAIPPPNTSLSDSTGSAKVL